MKSLKLACDRFAQSITAQKGLVREALIRYSPSFHVKKPKFLEQWVKEGKDENEILSRSVIAGMFTVATDTASYPA